MNMGAMPGIGGLGAALGGRMLGGLGGRRRRRRRGNEDDGRVDRHRGSGRAGGDVRPPGRLPGNADVPDRPRDSKPERRPRSAAARAESEQSELIKQRRKRWCARSCSALAALYCRSRPAPRRWTSYWPAVRSRASSTRSRPSSWPGKARPGLSEQQRATAVTQLKRALGRQTNPMALTMRGATGMMNSPSLQRMQRERTEADVGRRAAALGGRYRPHHAADRRRANAARDAAGDDRALGARHRRGARIGRARRRGRRRAVLRRVSANAAERLGAGLVPRGHHRLGSAPRRRAAHLDARQRGSTVVVGVAVVRRRVRRGRR